MTAPRTMHRLVVPDQKAAEPAVTPLSEDALAAEFVERHGREWRHVAAWGAWYRWTGAVWARDETDSVRDAMRHICRAAAATADTPAQARKVCSDRTISAALRIAATDPQIATRPADWDTDPMLLNTPAGILGLTSGEMLAHDPGYLITQITTAAPGNDCPLWCAFLDEITGGDADLRHYLQQLFGYCLTGDTSEQMFAFLHGSGANGKSVFVQTVASVLGSYAATATLDTFMASRTSRHLTELAGLRAARLVVVPETGPGRTWAEDRIKLVTGGERVRANFMHRDHFEFEPRFKLIVVGNRRPALDSVGEAMRRRLHLVPFEVTIPEDRRDRHLPSALLREADGILAWMLEGCRAWQEDGLTMPGSVLSASDEYFRAEDMVTAWIEECCTVGPEHRSTSQDLFRNWSAWAKNAGHDPGTMKALGEGLRERRFRSGKVRGARGWIGIAPRAGNLRQGDGP